MVAAFWMRPSCKEVNRRQGSLATDGVSSKGAGMGAGNPGHHLALGDHGPEGHSRGDPFGNGDDVRNEAPVFDSKHFSRAAHSGLNLIHNEEDAEVPCQLEELLMKFEAEEQYSRLRLEWVQQRWLQPHRVGGSA